jgi:alkylation response protein AidB-like acyl-CoA dehydrogenase
VVPYQLDWDRQRMIDRTVFARAAKAGVYGLQIDIAEAYVDKSVLAFNAGELSAVDAAKGKWYVSELQKSVIDRRLQLHGGYGYMTEYPVARAFLDTRVQTIYGGTTEIMKEIIGRDIAR